MSLPENRRTGLIASVIVMAIALGLYGIGVEESPLLSSEVAERKHYISEHSALDRATRRARNYWRRNPDVHDHFFFGEDGPWGIFGPRIHYDRHGRDEGRVWDQ